jgi:hypothetical protein
MTNRRGRVGNVLRRAWHIYMTDAKRERALAKAPPLIKEAFLFYGMS